MKKNLISIIALGALLISSCGESKPKEPSFAEQMEMEAEASEKEAKAAELENIGIGPIKTIELSTTTNSDMVATGKALFDEKCVACHLVDEKLIGPALKGITERRNPVWIMNMMLNPDEMIKDDAIAKRLMEEYKTPMLTQNLTEDESRAILEYFRTI